MKILVSAGLLWLALATVFYGQSARSAVPASAASAASMRQVLNRYCVTCHNSKLKTGSLSLEGLDTNKVAENAEVWEMVVRKVRAGMMPPLGAPRPDAATYESLASWLETELDRVAVSKPN